MYALLVQPNEAQTTRVTDLYVSMPGKRLSLVCCWGPAAFQFLGWICCESFGEGWLHFLQFLSVWQNWFDF